VVPVGLGLPCVATDRFDNFTAISNSTPIPGDKTSQFDKSYDAVTVLNFSSEDPQTQTNENNSETNSNLKIIHPKNATGTTTVYLFPKKQTTPIK